MNKHGPRIFGRSDYVIFGLLGFAFVLFSGGFYTFCHSLFNWSPYPYPRLFGLLVWINLWSFNFWIPHSLSEQPTTIAGYKNTEVWPRLYLKPRLKQPYFGHIQAYAKHTTLTIAICCSFPVRRRRCMNEMQCCLSVIEEQTYMVKARRGSVFVRILCKMVGLDILGASISLAV